MPVSIVLLLRTAEDAARCLAALLPTLPADVELLAGGTAAGQSALAALPVEREVLWLGEDGAAAWNAAAARAEGRDLVLLDGGTEVAAGWLDGLRAALGSSGDVATATALSNDAAFLSVPRRNLPWPLLTTGQPLSQAAERVRAAAIDEVPRIPTALPHCVLVARRALQLAGLFDTGLGNERAALADLCVRTGAAGLHHVAAPGVLVAHRRAEPDVVATDAAAWQGPVAERHPMLPEAVRLAAEDRRSALARALLVASTALEPLAVTVDARCLAAEGVTGTTVHVVELIGALARCDDVRVRVLLPERVGEAAAAALAEIHGIDRVTPADVDAGVARTPIVHRPWQVEAASDVAFLDRLGERVVLTNQDLIAYRTPGLFPDAAAWRDYRRVTADALGLAAMVLFFSERAARDAADEDLVPAERARVVPLGADARHVVPQAKAGRRPDALPEALDAEPFLLVLGNRFRHKNGLFALRLLDALRERHGWKGHLVFAGADVLRNSDTSDEAAWLLAHPVHRDAVHDAGVVGEAEKAWLLRRAAAVAYPSTYEGFGLVPFEAAAAGTPCLVAHVSSLRDILPADAATLVPWDPEASAARVAALLADGAAREAHVSLLRDAAQELTWDRTAAGLASAYRDALRLPAPPAARLADDIARTERDFWMIRDLVDAPAWRLVAPETGVLPADLQEALLEQLTGPRGTAGIRRALRIARRLPGRR